MQETLHEENQRLKRAVEELSILNDLARAIGASLNTQEIIQTIIRRSLRAIHAEQGVITLVDEHQQGTMKTLVRTMVSSSDHGHFHFDDALLGWMQLHKKPLIIDDPKRDKRFSGVQWNSTVHSLLAVPMMVKSEIRGVLTVYNKREASTFSDDDQRLLAIIAAQSAQVVENARLYEKEQAFLHMQEEVRLASRIQHDLLPKERPALSGYDIVGQTVPAQTVGGDYFDFIPIDEHRMAICLGDVSGKGLPASLLMANLQATLRGQTLLHAGPRECLQRANQLLFQSTSPEKFATVFYGILDTRNHTLSYTNAGHDPPFLLGRGGGVRRLNKGGIPLAMLSESSYEEETLSIHSGEILALYSDGVTEAINEHEEEFSEQRVEQVLLNNLWASAAELTEKLLAAVHNYTGTVSQSDDITIVMVRRTG